MRLFASFFAFALVSSSFAQIKLWDDPRPGSIAAMKAATISGVRSELTNGRSMPALESLSLQTTVSMPLPGGKQPTGRVIFNKKDSSGWQRTAGTVENRPNSSFMLSERNGKVTGLIRLRDEKKAYVIEGRTDGRIEITEKPLGAVECFNFPREPSHFPAPKKSAPSSAAPPILSSRPEATAVLYLDFDGAVVQDSAWEEGTVINAPPSNLNNDEIVEVWKYIAEDFRPFHIDVTTDPARYDAAMPGNRMRCIFTPDGGWAGNPGGIAMIGSFAGSGQGYSATVPCWVFNQSLKGAAEAGSHEIGHTLGLGHDGTSILEYFGGHGNWGPIMGASYDPAIVHWSKGEYADADNTEDDVTIIGGSGNGFGFAPDDASNAIGGADNINAPTSTVTQAGIISHVSDADVFRLPLDGGNLNITASPAPVSPNLDIKLVLMNEKGAILATSDTTTPDLTANITRTMAEGEYYLLVRNSGFGDPLTTGYSTYGSLGEYQLSGVIPGKSFPAGNLQPDLLVGKGKSRVGEGLFGNLRQEYLIEFGKKKKIKVTAMLANIGLLEERFNLKTSGRFSGHKYSISVKGHDVTKKMKSGGSQTHSLKPGQKLKIDIVFQPKRSLKKAKTLYLNAVALGDKQRTDKLGITLTPAKR